MPRACSVELYGDRYTDLPINKTGCHGLEPWRVRDTNILDNQCRPLFLVGVGVGLGEGVGVGVGLGDE
jgi:hypothetical protein